MRLAGLAAACLLGTGCFPYRVTYRPAFGGSVESGDGHPVGGVRVTACSASHFVNLEREGCAFTAVATSGADGRFRFAHQGAWEWFYPLPHEAPLPFTLVSACASDGQMGGAEVDPEDFADGDVHVTLRAAGALKLVRAGARFTGPPDAAAAVRRTCGPS
jgi:hypothetical protein